MVDEWIGKLMKELADLWGGLTFLSKSEYLRRPPPKPALG